jgi:hypothetical protein
MALENFASGSERKSCQYQCQSAWMDIVFHPGREAAGLRGPYNRVIRHFVGLAPRAHDEGVVEGDHGDDVDPLLLELGQVLDISWQVVDRAGGRKGSYQSESDTHNWRCQWQPTERL